MAVLETYHEVLFFISMITSEVRLYEFAVSELLDESISAGTFVVKGP
jgi:hypothetical protein